MSVIINGTTGIDKVQDGVVTDGKLLLTANSQEIKDALNASGNAPIYACRAWVEFTGAGTVAIRASGNVSSVVDNGVGDYTVIFTTPLPSANYCANLSTYDGGPAGSLTGGVAFSDTGRSPKTASACRIATLAAPSTRWDAYGVFLSIFC